MRCNDMPPFSSSVGERKIMNHFVVKLFTRWLWLPRTSELRLSQSLRVTCSFITILSCVYANLTYNQARYSLFKRRCSWELIFGGF